MTLPPVVSDPEACGARFEETSGEYGSDLPHVWEAWVDPEGVHQMHVGVCHYCGGRKP